MASDPMAQHPLEEKTEDSNNNDVIVEDELKLLLQEAGLESVPIDPSSLEALKAFVAKEDYNISVSVTATDSKQSAGISEDQDGRPLPPPPPVSEVEPHPELKRYTSELTTPSADSLCSGMEESSVAVAGSFVHVEGASPVENQILEALHRQTRLLLEMQRRIDDLTMTVEYLSSSGTAVGGGGGQFPKRVVNKGVEAPSKYASTTTAPRSAPTAQTPPPAPQERPNNNNNNDTNDNINGARGHDGGGGGGGGVLSRIRNSRLFKIGLVFFALRRRYGVGELDGGLIFKVLFMMAILTARMSSSYSKSRYHGDPDDWHNKFAIITFLVILGFLLQLGYVRYFYIFFVKENFAGRIWDGEDANAIIQQPDRQHANQPNHNNNNENQENNNDGNLDNPRAGPPAVPRGQVPPNHAEAGQGGGWRNTFFGGMIPQAAPGGIAGAVQDVALLFGSFLMSIFPMWFPEGPPRRVEGGVLAPEGGGPADAGDGGMGREAQNQFAEPGAVRPPRDAFQPADDSDDDDNNDGVL